MAKKDQQTLAVTTREVLGSKVSSMRKSGIIPANITGLKQASQAIQLGSSEFTRHVDQEGESGLLYLAVDGEKKEIPVLIEEIQYAPVDGSILHVSFRRVNLKEKVTAEVQVETTGEFTLKGANVVVVTDTLEVEALPADLPESFTVDVSKLTEIGQVMTIDDLEYDRDKITILMNEEERENPIVMAQEQAEEVEEAPAETETAAEAPVADSPESEPEKE